jgi:hypothetical protein
MYQNFHKYLGMFILVYLDDALLLSKNERDHVAHMGKIIKIHCKHQLYAKSFKCHFTKDELHYLGHIMGKHGVKLTRIELQLS